VSRYRFDQFVFDSSDGRLEHAGSGAALTLRPQVARLLVALLESPNTVIDRDTLCLAIWGEGAVVDFEAGLAAVVRELRQALDQLGGAAGLLETVPRRGLRFGAAVTAAAAGRDPDAETEPTRTGRPTRRVMLVAMLVLAMVLVWLLARWSAAPPAVTDTASEQEWTLAVLPFDRFGEAPANGARLELLLADALLARLWAADLEGIVLIGRATLAPYVSREDIAGAVARDLGVRLLIEGSIIQDAEGWRVTARLLHMPAGRVLWSDTIDSAGGGELPVRESAARLVESLAAEWAKGPQGTDFQ
jgi:DNA-binding winged helix-turn-helix (wHTH) protein/TolB-like protein